MARVVRERRRGIMTTPIKSGEPTRESEMTPEDLPTQHEGTADTKKPDEGKVWARRLAVSTVVTFFISGIGGALFQRYLARAKPDIAITSVGFQTSNSDLIEVPQEIITYSRATRWAEPLERYELLRKISDRERLVAEVVENLRVASGSTTEWLDSLPAASSSAEVQTLDVDSLREFPFFKNDAVGAMLIGAIEMSEMASPPYGLDQVRKLPSIGIVHRQPNGWIVRLGNLDGAFVSRDPLDSRQLEALELLAISTATGLRQNLEFYSNFFVSRAAEERETLVNLQPLLRRLILMNSNLRVVASIHNTGLSAAILRPYFGLKLENADGTEVDMVLGSTSLDQMDRVKKMMEEIDPDLSSRERRGTSVRVESFLKESSTSPYLTATQGKAETVTLVSVHKLRGNGQRIMSLYTRGQLQCRIVALTIDGDRIWSSPALFGETIAEGQQRELTDIMAAN